MSKKLTVITTAVVTATVLQLGIGQTSAFAKPAGSALATLTTNSAHAEAVYEDFMPLLYSASQLPEAVSYLNHNIYAVGSYRATMMTLKLENTQKAALRSWENKLSNNDVQRKLIAVYKPGLTISEIADELEDISLRTLLNTAGNSGYKLESADGIFSPVIDYGIYRKYKLYVANDIRDYITLMAAESDLPSAKDNSLLIAWTEVASRALSQESFIKSYPYSSRISTVKSLFNMYLTDTFYGLNNTPLFHYDNLEMDLEAQKAYTSLLTKHEDRTPYLDKLDGFMKLLKENGFVLDDLVEQYRSKEVPQD